MINEKDRAMCLEFRERLSERIKVIECRLFGSRARGDAEEDSDFDIFVEVEDNDESTERIISDVAWEVGFEHGVVITTVVYSRKELEEGPMQESLLYKNVIREGVSI